MALFRDLSLEHVEDRALENIREREITVGKPCFIGNLLSGFDLLLWSKTKRVEMSFEKGFYSCLHNSTLGVGGVNLETPGEFLGSKGQQKYIGLTSKLRKREKEKERATHKSWSSGWEPHTG